MIENPREMLTARRGEILAVIQSAVNRLLVRDWYLLARDVKEEAIAHRLAFYIEERIRHDTVFDAFDFAVDCEYDKFGEGKKTLLNTYDPAELPEREVDKKVRPDIIVHQRGGEDFRINLLAVEVKKLAAASPGSKSRKFARWKCENYLLPELNYMFAAYVAFRTAGDLDRGPPVGEFDFWAK